MLDLIANIYSGALESVENLIHGCTRAFDFLEPRKASDGRYVVPLVQAALVAVAISLYLAFKRPTQQRAPGPHRLPFLGNALQVPRQLQFVQFTEWSKTYGACVLCIVIQSSPTYSFRRAHIFS